MSKLTVQQWLSANVHLRVSKKKCLVPPFAVDYGGYVVFRLNGKMQRAHRVICEKFHGAPKLFEEAAHSCATGACVNPYHLSWKTHAANMRDTIAHQTVKRGESHHATSLTASAVKAIRDDARSSRAIALEYGVDRRTVSRIKSRETWGHVL